MFNTFSPIVGEERESIVEKMQHITGLKPGDKLKWKCGFKVAKSPQYEEIIEVSKVYPEFKNSNDTGAAAQGEYDFVSLFRTDDGDIVEFAFDSRRFELV